MAGRIGLRRAHALSALVLGLFLLAHLVNHLAMFRGVEAHQGLMAALRPLYRQPLVEVLLLALVLWQAGSGARLALASLRRPGGRVARLQAWSGLYLAGFLVVHVGAVLGGRGLGLDTDFNFAAAGFHAGVAFFFGPYYALAVAALFAHLGCAAWWRLPQGLRGPALGLCLLLGIGLGLGFVASMAGLLYPVTIPPDYLAPYGA